MAPRILFLDIETAPNLATVWSIWNQNIGINQLIDSGYVLCWAAKWKGQEKMMFDSSRASGKDGVVKSAWNLLNEADIVVHYNGKKFDIPTLNREFLLLRLPPPEPYKQVDLYADVKHKFMFVSHKMNYISKQLGFVEKHHTTHQLWLDCMNNKASAWAQMKAYNINDVVILEKIYGRLLGWIDEHPNMGLWNADGKVCCPNCGSKALKKEGFHKTKTRVYQSFSCKACGSWSRDRLSDKTQTQKTLVGIPVS